MNELVSDIERVEHRVRNKRRRNGVLTAGAIISAVGALGTGGSLLAKTSGAESREAARAVAREEMSGVNQRLDSMSSDMREMRRTQDRMLLLLSRQRSEP